MKNIPMIAICILVGLAMLAPLTSLADTPDPAAIEAQAAAAEIEKAFAQTDPGAEISKAIGDAIGSADVGAALLVPIMGIFGALIMPMLMVIIVCMLAFRYRDHKEQRNHETIRQMIEKGVPIPPDLSFGEKAETASPLSRGLKYIGAGAGLIVFFIVLGSWELAGIGAIPLFIGLAYLLSWHLDKKKTGTAGETDKVE